MTFIRWADVGIHVPRRGWPGRRRALARAWLQVVAMVVFVVLLMASFSGAVLIVWAAMLPAPAG